MKRHINNTSPSSSNSPNQSPPYKVKTFASSESFSGSYPRDQRLLPRKRERSEIERDVERERETEREMGRAPCCDKANVKKGPWSPEEDSKLKEYIDKYGTGGNWIALPQKAGNTTLSLSLAGYMISWICFNQFMFWGSLI